MELNTATEIIRYIKDSKKKTPVKVYIQGELDAFCEEGIKLFGSNNTYIAIGELDVINHYLDMYKDKIQFYEIESSIRNSAIPLLNTNTINARIEHGAIIREHVTIKDNAVIMMGACINIGSVIGANTMIDMNAVIGGRAIIGDNCHIGAGAVVAGVIEPASATPVIIGNNVLVGANAVILEGIKIGSNSIIGAGSIVTKDVEENTVVIGSPAKVLKKQENVDEKKKNIIRDLRKL